MKRLALQGASGHGKVVAEAALASGWDAIEFFDDSWPRLLNNGRWKVIGDTASLLTHFDKYDGILVSIGNCSSRWEKHQALEAVGATLAIVIHPSAMVSRYAELGSGTVVMAGAVIQVDAILGQAVIVNTGATIDHDCRLDDAVHISPGAHLSGHVKVGLGSWLGVGAAVKQGVSIGERVVVGAGAVVVHAVPNAQTVVGNPARVAQTRTM